MIFLSKNKSLVLSSMMIVLLVAGSIALARPPLDEKHIETHVRIVRFISGHELVCSAGPLQVDVRVLGVISAQETEPGGQQALAYARAHFTGRYARLTYPGRGRVQDRWGRHLAFVELLDTKSREYTDLGEQMIRAGHARPDPEQPSSRHDHYLRIENSVLNK